MAYTFKITIEDEEHTALQLILDDPDGWVEHAVRNKVRKCLDRVVEFTFFDLEESLTEADRQEIQDEMAAQGDALKTPKHYSDETKKLIAKKTKVDIQKYKDMAEPVDI